MDDIKKLIGLNNLSVSEAMQKIDANSKGILFLVDEYDVLVGCVTDGDIRRFLLAGGTMHVPVLKAANMHPKVAKNIEEARLIFSDKNHNIIPILDNSKKIISFYNGGGSEIIKKSSINIPVVINAGGRGTRLDPYTKVLPKPLIPIGDLPIIEHIINEYQSYNCNEFHIIVNYKKELMKAYFADNANHYNISWYDEKTPLGTGGGLTLLRGRFQSTFFFANCDALLTADYEGMLKFHKERKNVITMICAYKNINIPYGVVEMGNNGVIKKMQEKPLISFLTNTGIYIVEPEIIDGMQDGISIDFPQIIEIERQKGKRVAVFPVSENDWMDMGQLPELEKMRVRMYGE